MALPRLIVVTDYSIGPNELFRKIQSLLPLGSQLAIQHRHPEASGAEFFSEARALQNLCLPAQVPLFINGRLDVALYLGTHFHLPSSGMDISCVRQHLPSSRWISAAVHNEREILHRQTADFLLLSPVFTPGSKKSDVRPVLGTFGYETLAAQSSIPVYALGGVDSSNVRDFSSPGVAVISSVLHAPDSYRAAKSLLAQLN